MFRLFIVVFIYDILVYSKIEEDHSNPLQIVLQTLNDHKLYAKFSKCEFWLIFMTFLGHDPQKINAFKKWPRTMTQTDIRSFLGLVVYYNRYVESFSSIAAWLTRLTQ